MALYVITFRDGDYEMQQAVVNALDEVTAIALIHEALVFPGKNLHGNDPIAAGYYRLENITKIEKVDGKVALTYGADG